ncbi:3TM-type holin [Zooshikella ganghwensis]|uniref:3TM-type holin n=1 Tax=Zooshikella ganghwensis TaxID=202772 RepID=UPI00041C92F3|nr:3TM-type holin [Zooshikella ganghwensis]
MNWLTKLIGGGLAEPIDAIGNVLDKVTTSDAERMQAEILLERLRQQPQVLQVELNKLESQHRSLFVAGWRPFIGWVCGLGLTFTFLINPIVQWVSGKPGPHLPFDIMTELVLALLGLGTLRTAEKFGGRAK